MNATLWLALVLQFASVVLLRLGLGKAWLRRPATLLVLASVVYDGLSQVLLSFPSVGVWDSYRTGIQQSFTDEANLVMSAGMLAFTVAYLLTGPARRDAPLRDGDAALAARVLDWRLLALACAPLAVLTYEGRGYNSAAPASGPGVVSTFFAVAVTLACAGFLLRHGIRWLVPALAAQSLVLAAAGERMPVVAGIAAVLLLVTRAGLRVSGRQAASVVILGAVALAAITGVRASHGRTVFQQASGAQARIAALGGGVTAAADPGSSGFAAQFAVRADGTSFAGAVLQAQGLGQPRLDAAAVPATLLLAVPHSAWSSKPESGSALNPAQAQIDSFGLQQVNYLPTLPGLYTGYLTWPWLVLFLGAFGAAWGLAEKRVLACCTPARLIMLAGVTEAVFAYEAGLPSMLVVFRPAAVLALGAWLAGRLPASAASLSAARR